MPLYSYHPHAQKSSERMYSLYKATNEQSVGSGNEEQLHTGQPGRQVMSPGQDSAWTLEFPGPDACFWKRNVCFLIIWPSHNVTNSSPVPAKIWDYQVPAAHSDGSSRAEVWAACAGLLASCPCVLFHSLTGPHHGTPDHGSGCGLEGQWQGLQKMAVTRMQCGKYMDKEHRQDRMHELVA